MKCKRGGRAGAKDYQVVLRKSAPSSHSKEDQELKVPRENPTAPIASSDIKIKPVNYLSVALKSERIKQKAKVWCAFSLPLLGGIQLFFKWHRDDPFTFFHFLGQRVFYNIWSNHVNVSRQVLHYAFNSCCWCIKVHQEVPSPGVLLTVGRHLIGERALTQALQAPHHSPSVHQGFQSPLQGRSGLRLDL